MKTSRRGQDNRRNQGDVSKKSTNNPPEEINIKAAWQSWRNRKGRNPKVMRFQQLSKDWAERVPLVLAGIGEGGASCPVSSVRFE